MRYLRMTMHLENLVRDYQPAMVAYELVRRHSATRAAHVYGGLIAHIQSACERLKVPYTGVPVQTIKQVATGSGKASKADVIAAVVSRYGHTPTDDNEADAIMCAVAALDGWV